MNERIGWGEPRSWVSVVAAAMLMGGFCVWPATAAQAAQFRALRADQDQPSGKRPPRPARPARKPPQPKPEEGQPPAEPTPVDGSVEAAAATPPEGATPGVQPIQIPPDVQRQIDEIAAREAAGQAAPAQVPANAGTAQIPTGTVDRPDPVSPTVPTVNPAEGVSQARQSAEERRRQLRRAGAPGGTPAVPGVGPAAPGVGPDAAGGIVGSTINIPATEGGVPPEARQYSFSIKDAPYSVLIEGIAQQTGLGIIGSAPPDGTVTFITDEQLSFDALLQRVRELLFNYKPIDPYWILREENGLRVVRVVDYLRELKPELMFPSVEAFEAANLSDHELVLVLYTPKKGSLANLTVVRDFLPDYLRVTPMEGRNTVAIFALVRDIRKYLELVDIFVTPGAYDPRTLELIPVEFTTPSAAYEQLQKLMDADFGGQAGGAVRAPVRRNAPGSSPLENVPEPPVSVVPDDAQGVLIVRAMEDKIEEIKSLLRVVDVNTEVKYLPEVIPVQHNEPEAIIATVQQILARGGTTTPAPAPTARQSGRRPKRPRGSTPAMPAPGQPGDPSAGVTMMPHPAGSAIIVLADEETVAQVRKLVADLDLPTTIGPVLIAIEFAEPEAIVAAITQMMAGGASPPAGRPGAPGGGGVSIVTDPGGSAIWVTGSAKDVDRVKELVKEMDRAQDPPKLHVVRLVNQTPSFVAQILTQVDGGGGVQVTPSAPTGRGGRRVRPSQRPATPAGEIKKFTPDDENRRLFILCTEPEWLQYKAIIDDLESEPPLAEYEVVAVENIAPDEAIEKLQTILAGGAPGQPPAAGANTGLRMIASDTGIIIMGASPVDMSTIRSLLAEIDKPVEIEQRTFVVQHVNPADLKVALEQLLADGMPAASPRRRGGRRNAPVPPNVAGAPGVGGGGGGGALTIVQVENSLVVKAAPALMTQVAEFIEQFDVPKDKPEMRVYEDFPRGTDMYELVEAVQSLLNVPGTKSAPRARGAAGDVAPAEGEFAPRFVPQQAAGRLIIMARPEQFAEIEATLETLKNEISVTPVVTEFIQLKHADADAVVELVDPLLALHVERLIAQGEVSESAEDAAGAAAQVPPNPRVRQPMRQAKTQQRPYHLVADAANRRVVVAAEEAIVGEARRLVAAFDVPGSAVEPVEVAYINVKYGNPEEIVAAIDPVIAMKVQEFVAGGEISGEMPTVTTDPAGAKPMPGGRRTGTAMIRESRRYHLAPDVRQRRLVVAGPKSIIELTRKLVADFDLPGSDSGRVEIDFLAVAHGVPSELVERMDPILQMRVQQFVIDENLAADEAPVAGGAPALNRPRVGGKGDNRRYHLEPDDPNRQIIVAAPRPVIDEARALLAQMDKPVENDEIVFETVALENTDAAEMVLTISGLMQLPTSKGASVRRAPRKGAPPAAPSAPAAPSSASADADRSFTIVAAPGGGAVVLQGRTDEVAQAKSYITRLDAEAAGNKTVRVFQIHHADIRQLVNMIVSQVGIEEKAATRRPTPPRRPGVVPTEEEDFESEFEREITRTGADFYLHADLIADTLTVVTTPTKLAVIENLIGQVDQEDTHIARAVLPQMTYELKFADAFDAADNLRALLTATWQPDDEIPDVSYTSFGNLLVVRYPDESRFPEIEKLIAEKVDRDIPKSLKRKAIPLPPNMSAEEVAKWLETNLPDFDVKLENKTPEVQEDYGVEVVEPPVKSAARALRPCILPLSLVRAVEPAGIVLAGQSPPVEEPPAEEAEEQPVQPPVENAEEPEAEPEAAPPEPDPVDAIIRDRARPLLDAAPKVPPSSSKEPSEDGEKRDGAPRSNRREEIKVYYDNSSGNVIIEGPEDAIKDAPDWIEEMREGSKELNLPPDIRVIRVKYIDVRTAETIINEMFNATRAQNQQISAMNQARQQQMLQQRRMQQQMQQMQQQGRGQQPGQQPGQPPPGQQVPQIAMPEIPEAAVRVYANPRDRTLIVRADAHQYSAIYKLLATIDLPKPYDSTYRIYELTRLNAEDVESLLREWLGLDSGRGATSNRARRAARGAQPGQQAQPGIGDWMPELPETLVEPIEGKDTGLGIDPTDIKLSSNAQTNTILALAPVAALDYIGNLIKELEASAGTERVWRSYQLVHAQADDVVAFLEERFADMRPMGGAGEGAASGARGSRGGTGSSTHSGGLNSPAFVPYTRLNMLSVYATEDRFPDIEEALKRLDVPAAEEQYRHLNLTHADAGAVADTLTALFGAARSGGGRRTGGGAPGASSAPASEGPTFVGEPGGKIVFYRAPETLYPRIEQVVGELESQSKSAGVLRIIQLTHARPSDVARAVEQAYGGTRGGSQRTNRGGSAGSSTAGFTVTANDATKQLFVMADDALFAEVESLALALDQPAQIGFDFRIFPLQYADAKRVHETMTRLVQEYLQRLPRDQQQMEAFSVQPDEKANALVVLGGPVVFGFVEEALKSVDVPANARDKDAVMMVVLENGDANEVAQSVNRLWSQRLKEGEKPPVAEPVRSLNALVVRGTQSQLDSIKKEFIDPLQSQAAERLATENIPLKFARAEDVAQTLMNIYDERRQALKDMGPQGSAISPLEQTVVITADPVTNQLVVQASTNNLEEIRRRVAQVDVEDVARMSNVVTRVYTPTIADPEAVAAMIRSMAVASESKGPGRGGSNAPGQTILAIAEPGTRSVVVTANGQNHARIKEIIDQLDSEAAQNRAQQVRTFVMKYAEPDLVVDAVSQLFKPGKGKSGGEVTAVAGGGNSVVVSAMSVDMARIEELITKLDSPDANLRQVYVINLQNADAESVAGTLDQVFVKSAPQRKGAGGQPITISALKGSKAVMVRCSPEDYETIAAAVTEIDREEALVGESVRVVTLFYTDATEMFEAVQDYLRKPGGAGGGKGSAAGDLVGNTRVSVLTQTNALVVSGDQEKVGRIVGLISDMDKAGEVGSRPRIIVLTHAKVNQVLPVLMDMFGEQSGSGGGSRGKGQAPPVITANAALNALIVRAGPTDMAVIEDVVAGLDTERVAQVKPFLVVQLAPGLDLEELAETVEQNVNESALRQAPVGARQQDVPSITVSVDARSSSLIIGGSPQLFEPAELLARDVENRSPQGNVSTRVIRTENLSQDEVEALIEKLTNPSPSKERSGGRSRPNRPSSRPSNR